MKTQPKLSVLVGVSVSNNHNMIASWEEPTLEKTVKEIWYA